jgi:hypothetical protein
LNAGQKVAGTDRAARVALVVTRTALMIIGAEEAVVGRAAVAAGVGVFTVVMCARPSCSC